MLGHTAFLEFDPTKPGPSDTSLTYSSAFADTLERSYKERLGTNLVPASDNIVPAAHWLYQDAPFCLLVHNTARDPRFIYCNMAAQACFEYSWDEMTRLPSRLSADSVKQAERQELLDAVHRYGYATGYRGLRIAKSGRRFWIDNVTMWQLFDDIGTVCGQAAIYSDWRNA